MARWIKAAAPWIEVIGVVAAGAPAMATSWRAGRVVVTERAATIADGIGVRVPVSEALADLAGLLDDVVEVDDDTLVAAMRAVHRHAGLVVEPAGVAGIAALLADRPRYAGRRVATVLCGGNLTDQQIAMWLGPRVVSPTATENPRD
jgi:threonine dehydratase